MRPPAGATRYPGRAMTAYGQDRWNDAARRRSACMVSAGSLRAVVGLPPDFVGSTLGSGRLQAVTRTGEDDPQETCDAIGKSLWSDGRGPRTNHKFEVDLKTIVAFKLL